MTSIRDSFFSVHLALVAFALCDAWGTALATGAGGAAVTMHVVYLLPWTVLFAVPLTVAVGALRGAARRTDWRSTVIVGSGLVAAHYAVVLAASTSFRNRELAALLVTAIAVGLFGAAAMVLPAVRRAFTGRTKQASGAAGFAAAAVLSWLAFSNRDGFDQLDRWTLVAPVVALFVYASLELVARRASRVVGLWPRIGATLLVVSIGLAATIGAMRPQVPGDASREGPWSRYLARAVQAVSDFDGDGASSLFGGADCAPFDANVGPGRLEVPGDGVDNNCVGGDASVDAGQREPEWVDVPTADDGLNFLLISVEALRPDHTSFGGYHRDTTPNLATLAADSVVFDRFYSASTFTRLSLPSLLTSRSPSAIDFDAQAGKKMPRVANSNPWLPEVLREEGFRTGAVMTNFAAFGEADSIGFDRGFEDYDLSSKLRYRGGTMRGFPAKKQTDRVLEFVEENKSERFFAWVHYVEPHYKYEAYPGSPDFGDDDIAKYDREIWGVDQEVGRILDRLRKDGLLDKSVIFVTGDHGEEFMEHGKRFHGTNLYEPQVRTVGLLWVPGMAARRVSDPATAVDVAPTVANLLGVRREFPRWHGRNLTGLLLGRPVEDRPLFLETWSVTTLKNYMVAVVAWPYKLVWREDSKKSELYNLAEDSAERDDLAGEQEASGTFKEMERMLFDHIDNNERVYRPVEGEQ